MRYTKHSITIYIERAGRHMDVEELGSEAMGGAAICTSHESETVDETDLPDGARGFFGLGEVNARFDACKDHIVAMLGELSDAGVVEMLTEKDREALARDVYDNAPDMFAGEFPDSDTIKMLMDNMASEPQEYEGV